jgi:hypothetical protein
MGSRRPCAMPRGRMPSRRIGKDARAERPWFIARVERPARPVGRGGPLDVSLFLVRTAGALRGEQRGEHTNADQGAGEHDHRGSGSTEANSGQPRHTGPPHQPRTAPAPGDTDGRRLMGGCAGEGNEVLDSGDTSPEIDSQRRSAGLVWGRFLAAFALGRGGFRCDLRPRANGHQLLPRAEPIPGQLHYLCGRFLRDARDVAVAAVRFLCHLQTFLRLRPGPHVLYREIDPVGLN